MKLTQGNLRVAYLRLQMAIALFSAKFKQKTNSQNIIVKFRINWALSNSLNTYNRDLDWKPKLKVCATNVNVSIYF